MRIGVVLHRWHRRLGVFASGFLIWLAATGVLLNQSVPLHLDARRVDWPWLMRWYGLAAQAPVQGWQADGHWLAVVDDRAALDGRLLDPAVMAPLGLVAARGLLYVATADSLVLLKPDGSRIDTLRAPPLPVSAIRRIGSADQRVAVQDLDAYASADGEDWTAVSAQAVVWAQPQRLPEAQQALVARLARPSLPLARILVDVHSGRILGSYGVALINVAASFAIVLAISGLWMWRRALQRQQRHGRIHSERG